MYSPYKTWKMQIIIELSTEIRQKNVYKKKNAWHKRLFHQQQTSQSQKLFISYSLYRTDNNYCSLFYTHRHTTYVYHNCFKIGYCVRLIIDIEFIRVLGILWLRFNQCSYFIIKIVFYLVPEAIYVNGERNEERERSLVA